MTAKTQEKIVDHRYDFVLLFDVKNGNPNGDPDAGNMPRLDSETMHGFVTDGCVKRKIRDYIELIKSVPEGGKPEDEKDIAALRYEIYVKHRGILANEQRRAFKALGVEPSESPNLQARVWMCRNFYDVRTFGAVMSTGKSGGKDDDAARGEKKKLWNCGQVRGPAQITFSRSVDPIVPLEASITRVALTNAGDTKRASVVDDEGGEKAGSGQMGRKNFVPYALYMGYGFISPAMARDTGFSFSDLDLLFNALVNMFDHDRSASRGLMGTRRLYVFQHASPLGNASAHKLFERIERGYAGQKKTSLPRDFSDYPVLSMDELKKGLPQGIVLRELVEEGLIPTPWTR